MIFPTIVYKDGGPHQRPGGTYAYVAAPDQESYDDLLENGYKATLEEIVDPKGFAARKAAEDESQAESQPPAVNAEIPLPERVGNITLDEDRQAVAAVGFLAKAEGYSGTAVGSQAQENLEAQAKTAREELEADAAKLGIKVHWNMKDETLAAKIKQALESKDSE